MKKTKKAILAVIICLLVVLGCLSLSTKISAGVLMPTTSIYLEDGEMRWTVHEISSGRYLYVIVDEKTGQEYLYSTKGGFQLVLHPDD